MYVACMSLVAATRIAGCEKGKFSNIHTPWKPGFCTVPLPSHDAMHLDNGGNVNAIGNWLDNAATTTQGRREQANVPVVQRCNKTLV